ncbi:MAG: FxsA family protein [Gammaproteobacteria bacterium]
MFFLLFLSMTLLEIWVLRTVSDAITFWPTLALVIITALIGSSLLKHQGWSTMAKAKRSIAEGKTPAFEMMEGVVILISGVMLLTPGFITDAIGLLGLIPLSRRYFINNILEKNASKVFNQRNAVFTYKMNQPQPPSERKREKKDDAIEGEFWED